VLDLNGKPLIAWTIEAALQAETLDCVFVSTEDEEIARISECYGATVIERPPELAKDMTSSEAVIEHAITSLKSMDVDCKVICLLQPTSPLRTTRHINQSLKIYGESGAHCVISVFEPSHSVAKAYSLQPDGSIKPLLSNDAPFSRRQDLPKCVLPNGAIYVFGVESFLEAGGIPRKAVYPMLMSERDSIDIDDADDMYEAARRLGGSS